MKFGSILLLWALFVTLVTGGPALAAEDVYYYHTDTAGTPLAMSNATGQKVWEADYKPFGEEYSVSGTKENDRRFVGKEKDEETGLNYFGARYLAASTGRFLAPDPVRAVDKANGEINEEVLEHPQRCNLYSYALNNPYVFMDSDGKSPVFSSGFDHDGVNFRAGGGGGYARAITNPRQLLPAPSITKNAAVQQYYPSNNGFLGNVQRQTLMKGDLIDRFGGADQSRFFSPAGTPAAARSLPTGTAQQPLRTFEVLKPFEVEAGKAAPAYGQPGLGTQFRTPVQMKTLIERGLIKEIKPYEGSR